MFTMVSHSALILLILLCLAFLSGCIKNQEISPVTPAPGTQAPLPAGIQGQPEGNMTLTVQPAASPAVEQTIIKPTPTVSPSVPVPTPVTIRPDPTIVFRDQTIMTLDDLQAKKEAIITSYRAGDITRVKERAEEYAKTLRKKSTLAGMPQKMDYIRVSYYDYTDRADQCARSFADGADRWLANDKSSANSYFDAGIIASERADMADKRIRTFFRDYVHQVQVNQS